MSDDFYMKTYKRTAGLLVAVCDKELVGKTLKADDVEVNISTHFYKDKLVGADAISEALRGAFAGNFFGKKAVALAIANGVVSKEGVKTIPVVFEYEKARRMLVWVNWVIFGAVVVYGAWALVETFGENPLVRVLDFFLMYPSFDYSKSQVAREVGISRITMEKILKRLVKNGAIVKTREIGNAELFKLNVGNAKVKALMKFDFELSSASLEQEEKESISVEA